MRLRTRSGVHLTDEEFHGIMAAVARRINRTAHFGHPDASVGDQPTQLPPGPQNWQQMFQPPQEDQGASEEPQATEVPVRDQGQGMGEASPLQPATPYS